MARSHSIEGPSLSQYFSTFLAYSRLASIALGTDDIDCVYHFALYELQATVNPRAALHR
ncbi:TPA: hypothetical protein QDB46_003851 [Burkholderia multivorans]|uniref:NgoMIV family type II restriction endonuclease n=1 Tax=Burkholderia multivorans TaxID=87883 RepID=UPI001C25ECEC|nr:hypothetical protein [Burkholderia multivorans]HDR9288703.1 hypothetical protein [Burkholderia multivorans]HDR9294125.1 hypothetical protein [Burkholderia multivorans]HDR9300019.1 hypothetical protein [Burkholderia multivorans]HDR9307227.1 hypothetical protein [Burkholderia multivorans]